MKGCIPVILWQGKMYVLLEPNTATSTDRERRRRRGDHGKHTNRWKRSQQTHTRKVDILALPTSQPLQSFIHAFIHKCVLQSRACNKQAPRAMSFLCGARCMRSACHGARPTELDRAVL